MNTLPPDDTTPESRAWQEWVERLAVGDPVEVDGAAGAVVGIGDNGVMVQFADGAEPVPCSWDSLTGAPASVATDAALRTYYGDGSMVSLRVAIVALSNEIDEGGPDPVNVRDGLLLSCLVDERDNLNFAKRLGWTDPAQDGIGWALGELGRVRALLADAELALAMARGDWWPAGWKWSESDEGFQSPNDDAYIQPLTVDHLGEEGMMDCPIGWRLYRRDKKIRGASKAGKTVYPTALAALRDYLAGVTP